MNKILLHIFILLIIVQLNVTNAKVNHDKINDDEIMIFVAKKLFQKKKYIKSEFLFQKVIARNCKHNDYSDKSKLYLSLMKYKKKQTDIAEAELNIFINSNLNSKYTHQAHFLYAIVNYSSAEKKALQKIIITNKTQKDQVKTIFSLKILEAMLPREHQKIVNERILKLKNDIKRHEIYIAKFYLVRKAYISAANRINLDSLSEIKNEYDFKKVFILIKALNELYLSDIAKAILSNLEFCDKIKP